MNKSRAFALLSIIVKSSLVLAEDVSTVKLHYRTANDIAAVITPLLDVNEKVVPTADLLVIKASPARVHDIRELISQLDVKPRMLTITVAHGRGLSHEALVGSFATTSTRGHNNGDSTLNANGHFYETESDSHGGDIQRVQTLDGKSAVIQFGERTPTPSQIGLAYGPIGGLYTETTQYVNAGSGFKITPRTTGETVTLELAPWSAKRSQRGDGSLDTELTQTTLRIPLGEWIEIGGQDLEQSTIQAGLQSQDYATRSENHRIFIRVDQADENAR